MAGRIGMSCLARIASLLAACLLMVAAAACAPAAAPDDADTTVEPTVEGDSGQPEPMSEPTAEPTSIAQEPPGDCWGGALSEDTLQCHLLEEAQKAGRLKVVGVYEAPNEILHIFMEQSETLTEADGEFLSRKAREFLASAEGRAYVEEMTPYKAREACDRARQRNDWSESRWQECAVGFPSRWHDELDGQTIELVPPRAVHGQIYLRPGGVDGRREALGWASWRQLWPEVSPVGTQRVSGTGGFDISDVDTVNIPEPDCDQFYSSRATACMLLERYPETGIAGIEWDGDLNSYVQVKGPLPPDEAGLEALKRRLDDQYGQPLGPDFVVLIPVKYDFGQMWRWSEILNRFALSAGNTIGLTDASIGYNTSAYAADTVFLSGLTDWGGPTIDNADAVARIRATVVVGALDVQAVVDALPELLPLLGIPVDAVGVVVDVEESWEPVYLD